MESLWWIGVYYVVERVTGVAVTPTGADQPRGYPSLLFRDWKTRSDVLQTAWRFRDEVDHLHPDLRGYGGTLDEALALIKHAYNLAEDGDRLNLDRKSVV